MTPAAFFDMDRTLIRANSGTLWVRWMRERKEMTRWKMLQAIGWIAQYKLAILDMEAVITKLIAELEGEPEQAMIEKCLEFTNKLVLPTVAPKGLQALAFHREQGHVLAILSSSSPYVTEPLARHLGIEHVLCTRPDIRDGKFVGTHVRPACYGAGKVHWAEAFAKEQQIDLGRSFFYTDSYSDLPMLKRVGIQKVVNPDTRLKRHARRAGWEVDEW